MTSAGGSKSSLLCAPTTHTDTVLELNTPRHVGVSSLFESSGGKTVLFNVIPIPASHPDSFVFKLLENRGFILQIRILRSSGKMWGFHL